MKFRPHWLCGSLTLGFLSFAAADWTGPFNFTNPDDAAFSVTGTPPVTLVASGSAWKYRYEATGLGPQWREPTFDDSHFNTGLAQFGYGDQDETTPLNPFPGGATEKPITAYFRRQFNVGDPASFARLILNLVRDDGALICLNGVEVWRENLPLTGAIEFSTPALVNQSEPAERAWHSKVIDPSLLVSGVNTLAIEVHQQSQASNDLSFDFELLAETGNPDVDGDGLPDAWEQAFLGSPGQAASDDPDGDGASNALEWRAHTHPADAASLFRAELASNPVVALTWSTVIGLRYRINISDDLTAWTPLLQTLKGTGALVTWTDDGVETGGIVPRRFYRVTAGE